MGRPWGSQRGHGFFLAGEGRGWALPLFPPGGGEDDQLKEEWWCPAPPPHVST